MKGPRQRRLSGPAPDAVTRREVLRRALAAAVALVLAACGQDAPTPAMASRTPSSAPSAPSPGTSVAPRAGASTPPSQAPVTPAPTPAIGLEQMIAGLMVVGFRGSRLADAPWLESALHDRGLGGVILFDRDQRTGGPRNVRSPAQVARLTARVREAAGGRAILVGVDQEGGVVTRLGPSYGFPPVASEADAGRMTAGQARAWARGIAQTLASSGIDLNFAPVVDLDVNPDSPAIGALDRSFSADPDVVVRRATIEIRAHRAAGILTTLKHFPGIGSATANTDFGVADVTKTWTRAELDPFRRLIAAGLADLVMAGHVVNRRLDPDHPACLSRAVVTGLLRGELGWDGVVVTDDLQAQAITDAFGRDKAVLLALDAGNDLLLFANQQVYEAGIVERVVDAVGGAVAKGRLPEARIVEAWTRVQRVADRAGG